MNSRFPKTREALTKEWELSSLLDLGWSSDGDTLQDLYNRNNGSFDISSCYYYDSSSKLYKNVQPDDMIDSHRGYWIKKSTSETVSTSDLVTLTAFFTQLTHYDQTMNTANGFLYILGDKRYIVTTTHLIFDTPRSQEPQMARMVKCRRKELELYCYSRYYDVAIYNAPNDTNFNSLSTFDTYSYSIPRHVRVNYLDPNTGNTIKVSSKYVNIVQAPIELGAVGHKLIRGASGSAVTDIRGKLVGMVSSCGDTYDNMSLCIPAATIHNIINSYQVSTPVQKNFDLTNKIYPSLVSQPLQPGHLEALPDIITGGELVTISTNRQKAKPFDIVTHIEIDNEWISVGKDTNLSSQLLDNQNKTKFNLKVQQCNESWRKTFGSLPRTILGKKVSLFVEKLLPIRYIDFDVRKDGQTVFIDNSVGKNTDGLLDVFQSSVIRDGMQAKIIDNNNIVENNYVVIKNIDFINKTLELDKDISDITIKKLRIYLLSGNYYYNATTINEDILNEPTTDGSTLLQQVFQMLSVDEIDKNTYQIQNIETYEYIVLVISHLVRHWAFLVITQLNTVPVGYQHIVWAKECDRLTKILYDLLFSSHSQGKGITLSPYGPVIFNRCVINIYLKLIEFLNYQVIMFLAIFITNWNSNIREKISTEFPSETESLKINSDTLKTVFKVNLNLDIENTNSITNNLVENDGILFDTEGTMKDDPDLLKGFTTYNTDGYSREFRNMKNRTDQLNTSPQELDYITRELELVYKELEKITYDSFKDGSPYYFNSYSIMKSFWDHGNLNLGGIIGAINNDTNIYQETEISITNDTLPPYLSSWNFLRLLNGHDDDSC